MDLNQIQTPTFVVNTGQCRQNIQKIKHKADRDQVLFRPHFKTHQSVHIAGLFKEAGIKAICVSSVSMAKQFIQQGWKDITIAFPFNVREINRLKDLQLRARINILIDNPDTALILDHATELETGFFIEIDTGYHRSGIPAENIREISSWLNLVKNPQLKFKGFLSHFGNSYSASSVSEIKNIFKSGIKQLNLLKSQFIREYPEIIISVGDTPTASLVDDFSGVGEIRPGNFVYYDVFQYFLGSCLASEIACYVACPVVSLKKERQEAIIYGGGVHLSKESVATEKRNQHLWVGRHHSFGFYHFHPSRCCCQFLVAGTWHYPV